MTNNEVVKILKTERECVNRNNGVNCDRQCNKCDLVLPADKIITAYDIAIKLIGGDNNG